MALLPHHFISNGCWSRLIWVFYLTKGNYIGLNLFAYSDYELIDGAIITLYAKAYGIGGGYLSPFFFFWGIASVGFSLNSGSAVK